MNRLLLKPSEAAELIGIGRSQIYALIAAGVFPVVRVGSEMRIPARALDEWIERKLKDSGQRGTKKSQRRTALEG